MLLEKIESFAQTNPTKKALSWRNESVDYKTLYASILKKARWFQAQHAVHWVVNHVSPIQNCIDWVALMAVGKVGILAPKELQNDYFSFLEIHAASAFCSDFTEIETTVSSTETELNFPKLDQQTIFLGVLSSGSSGVPKLIWKDYQAWFSAFPYQSAVFGISEKDHLMVLDALSYSANANATLHMLWTGGSVTFFELSKAKKWGECIEKEKITSVFLVPSHLQLIVQQKANFLGVRSVVTAGEKLSIPLAQSLLTHFENAQVTEYYGAAELGHISYHQNEELLVNPFSVGRPFPQVEIEIKGQEIAVSSPYVSPAYRGKKATVGDLGEWADGKLLVLGRGGRVFNRRGVNIFAQEIESVAKTFADVHDVLVLEYKVKGISKLILFFTTSSPFSYAPQFTRELQVYLHQKLPKSKCPSFLKWVEEIPKMPSGKIDYQEASRRFLPANNDEEFVSMN
ncbi:MAG: AMP-binding protein [Spirosomataceae bacterium]